MFTSCIEQAEDERTAAAQQDAHNVWRQSEEQHTQRPKLKLSIKTISQEVSYRARNFIRGLVRDAMGGGRQVKFNLKKNSTKLFHNKDELQPGTWRDGSPKYIPEHRQMEGTTKPSAQARSKANLARSKEPAPKGTRREKRKLLRRRRQGRRKRKCCGQIKS